MSSSERRAWLTLAAATGAGVVLAGCGFKLRQPARLQFGSIALTGFALRSPLAEALTLKFAPQVRVQETPVGADVVLQAIEDTRERNVVAYTSAAQVRGVYLRVKFTFRAHTPAGRELIPRAELLIARDLSYTETAALSKELAEAELFREMQADIAEQVLRRLAALTL